MPFQKPLGPFCQSCSMPLRSPEDFGTDEAGYRVNDYCRHCFVKGAFTEPTITMEQMLERCVTVMADQQIMPAAQARTLMEETLPRLKRWNQPVGNSCACTAA
ncbi:MAG TPA: zinc ribbon domain-containing protein [Gemmatimonadales bacterium]